MTSLPSLIQCSDCHKDASNIKDTWWCRDCAVAICRSCNLMHGHTEHRSAPWKETDVLKTCVNALESRVEYRTNLAASEEIEVIELLAEVQKIMLRSLHRKLDANNSLDKSRLGILKNILGLQHSKSFSKNQLNPPLGDDVICCLLEQTANCCQAHPGAVAELLPNDVEVNLAARKRQGHNIPAHNERLTLDGRVTPECIVGFLSGEVSARRQRTPSSDDSGAFCLTRERNGYRAPPPPLVTSTPYDMSMDEQDSAVNKFKFPLEPQVHICNGPTYPLKGVLKHSQSTEFTQNRTKSQEQIPLPPNNSPSPDMNLSRSSLPTARSQPLTRRHGVSELDQTDANIQSDAVSGRSSVQLMLPDESINSATQSPIHNQNDSRAPDEDWSGISTPSDSTRLAVVAFHFGSDYLTRPIDVCALPQSRLAVSDSCGGVYITNLSGDMLHKIEIGQMSASSLYYSPARNNLFVSLLASDGRHIHIYNANSNYPLFATLRCPTEPKIDMTRTRWLAATSKGNLFVVSGDNNKSALWTYDELSEVWVTVCTKAKSRWQYLYVNEDRPHGASTVLLTCDGLTGSVLLLVIGGNNRLWAEYNLCQSYHLYDYIKSPASAVSDLHGNLLILDYHNGRLWLLADEKKDVRRLSPVAEMGSQGGLGLAVCNGWCYVACLSKKRIQAVKYMEVADRHLSNSSLREPISQKKSSRSKSRH